jgi:histidine ammonia-lyase
VQGSVRITGRELDPPRLLRVARHRAQVELAAEAVARMQAAQDVVGALAARGEPVYGVTTGLGSRVIEPVDGRRGAEFSLRTLRGRATAVGEPLPVEVVRAAMVVRLNGLSTGGAGRGGRRPGSRGDAQRRCASDHPLERLGRRGRSVPARAPLSQRARRPWR